MSATITIPTAPELFEDEKVFSEFVNKLISDLKENGQEATGEISEHNEYLKFLPKIFSRKNGYALYTSINAKTTRGHIAYVLARYSRAVYERARREAPQYPYD